MKPTWKGTFASWLCPGLVRAAGRRAGSGGADGWRACAQTLCVSATAAAVLPWGADRGRPTGARLPDRLFLGGTMYDMRGYANMRVGPKSAATVDAVCVCVRARGRVRGAQGCSNRAVRRRRRACARTRWGAR